MRFLILTLVIVAGLIAFGWIYIENDHNSSEIVIDKHEVRQDTRKAIQDTRDFIHDVDNKIRERVTDETEPTSAPVPAPADVR